MNLKALRVICKIKTLARKENIEITFQPECEKEFEKYQNKIKEAHIKWIQNKKKGNK
jgi:hypothetical protein